VTHLLIYDMNVN